MLTPRNASVMVAAQRKKALPAPSTRMRHPYRGDPMKLGPPQLRRIPARRTTRATAAAGAALLASLGIVALTNGQA
jgi:hypothetical protein